MKTKYIILDAMGVIFKQGDDFENIYLPYLKAKYNFNIKIARELYYNKLTLGKISLKEFFKELKIPFDLKFIKKLEIDPEFYGFTKNNKQDFKLIVLSNDCLEFSKEIISEFKLNKIINKYFTSGELGIRKPNTEVFIKLLKILKAKPEECILVDNILENLEPAKSLGIKTIYFEREKSKVNTFSNLYKKINKVIKNE
jgi:putative hydrolase of the HAD superfamily